MTPQEIFDTCVSKMLEQNTKVNGYLAPDGKRNVIAFIMDDDTISKIMALPAVYHIEWLHIFHDEILPDIINDNIHLFTILQQIHLLVLPYFKDNIRADPKLRDYLQYVCDHHGLNSDMLSKFEWNDDYQTPRECLPGDYDVLMYANHTELTKARLREDGVWVTVDKPNIRIKRKAPFLIFRKTA